MSLAYPLAIAGVLVIANDGSVLLTESYKWAGVYSIPGGKIDLGERALDCARREVKEETGLDVDRIEFVLYQDAIYSTQFFKQSHFVALNFIAHLAAGCQKEDVQLNEEHQNHIWVSPEEALKLPLNDLTRVLIETALITHESHFTAPTAPRSRS